MISSMLVPVDGSAHSKKALEFAAELAARFDASLSLVHVVEWVEGQRTLVLGTARTTIEAPPEAIEEAGRSVLDAAESLAREHGAKVASATVRRGAPAREILDAASESGADTIVMGSRGLSDIGGLLLGSVSHKVSHLAPCTCIVVR